jgi:hypothetical protein
MGGSDDEERLSGAAASGGIGHTAVVEMIRPRPTEEESHMRGM